MNATCEALGSFVDGALDAAEARAFERHLPDCGQCARGLAEHLILDQLVLDQAPRPVRAGRRWRVPVGALALAAGVALFFLLARARPAPQAPVLVAELAAARPRTHEARLSYLAADSHRPYAPLRGGPAPSTSPLTLLGRIETTGDGRAVAAADFLVGMQAQAETQLATLPESADVLCDRGAVLLELGRAEEALPLLERALRLAPAHRQARWNHALALRALGRNAEAAQAFDELAAAEVPGWREEARQRAQDLRR